MVHSWMGFWGGRFNVLRGVCLGRRTERDVLPLHHLVPLTLIETLHSGKGKKGKRRERKEGRKKKGREGEENKRNSATWETQNVS